MKTEGLLASTGALKAPSPESVSEFAWKRTKLETAVNKRFFTLPGAAMLIEGDWKKMTEGCNRSFGRFMESVFRQFEADVFVETALLAFRAYRNQGFQNGYWPASLSVWLDTMEEGLSQRTFQEVSPFFRWLKDNIPLFVNLTEEEVA